MKIYSKQDYKISMAIRNLSTAGVKETGEKPPYFSTFSGITPNNVIQEFNVCVLDQDVTCDEEFIRRFNEFREECAAQSVFSTVFYHPENVPLAEFMDTQLSTATGVYVPTRNLSSEYISDWLSADYLQGRLPDRLDRLVNRPVLTTKRISCPLWSEDIWIATGLGFHSLQADFGNRLKPIEKFLRVTDFTETIGANVMAAQLDYADFILYSKSAHSYASPHTMTCPFCSVRIPLDINELMPDRPTKDVAHKILHPFYMTDECIKAVRNAQGAEAAGTGEWIQTIVRNRPRL